jgi:hypothetical protein
MDFALQSEELEAGLGLASCWQVISRFRNFGSLLIIGHIALDYLLPPRRKGMTFEFTTAGIHRFGKHFMVLSFK